MITPEPTDAADAVLAWSRAEQADIEAGRDDYRGADWRAGAIDSHIQLRNAIIDGKIHFRDATKPDPAASRDQDTIGVRALIDAYASEDHADGDYGDGFRRDRVAGEAFDALRAVAGLHDEMDRRIGRALLKAARPTPPPPRAEPGHWQWRGYDQLGQDVWSWEPPEPAGGER